MFLEDIKILNKQGQQYIKDLSKVNLPDNFKGKPIIHETSDDLRPLVEFCPAKAITISEGKLNLNLGKCNFCGDCAHQYPNQINFSSDYRIATNDKNQLIFKQGQQNLLSVNPELIRKEIKSIFNRSLKLRQVSAGGDACNELELGACGNVNFDMGRYGIEFTASPRHADGIVVTGPITENMTEALQIAYEAVPKPSLFILAGTDAISGGLFADSPAVNRTILNNIYVDLYIPGDPIHPLTFIHGILELTRQKFRKQ